MARPLLFLDVDGTLLPMGGAVVPTVAAEWAAWQTVSNPQLAKLVPAHGPRLLALGCDLIWATAWQHDANDVIGPALGLPSLPVVEFPDVPEEDWIERLSWKTAHLVEFAAGRPFVWIDDETTDYDRMWIAAEHPAPALVQHVDSTAGITDADFRAVAEWLRDNAFPT